MKILETQSAILTNAEVLAHIRGVHRQSLKNHEYSTQKGAKLRPLKNVIEEVHRSFRETGLTTTPLDADTPAQSTPAPAYPKAPVRPSHSNPPTPSPLRAYGDERIPLDATLDAKPADAVPLAPLPRGPRVQRLDATEVFLAPRPHVGSGAGKEEEARAAAQRFWDPHPTLYTPVVAARDDDDAEARFVPEVLELLGGVAHGRAALTKGEKVMICNLRPRSAFEVEYVVEEAEGRLGGEAGVEALAARLAALWDKYGWVAAPGEGEEEDGARDVQMTG